MIIKLASDLSEFSQIHQLNYKTFVEEIPQHKQNEEKKLVDKFHDKNHYIIAKKGEEVIGMVCYNLQRPFSIEAKVNGLENYLPEHTRLAEIRLLSIRPDERKTRVSYRLLQYLCQQLIGIGTDMAVISGTTRQLRLYSRIGFIPFGPLVGNAGALFQPMYITLKGLRDDFRDS